MPLTNGDAIANSVPLLRGKPSLDYTKALEVLENEYPEKDGLDVYTLLDSTKNGALTYNDFLVLPGYIGTAARLEAIRTLLTITSQASQRQRSLLIRQSPSASPSKLLSSPLLWTRSPSTRWRFTWLC